jgi:hypothetical protein
VKTLLRIGFVALIGLGLASQVLRAGRADADAGAQDALVGRLARLQIQATELPASGLLAARSAACDSPFVAGLLQSDGADSEVALRFAGSGTVIHYAYLGAVDPQVSRTKLLARWAWASLLFNVGLRQAKPPSSMAVVAYPRSCAALDAIDWATLSP